MIDLWGDSPFWPVNSSETSKVLRAQFESEKPFTIILPFYEKALWAPEVLDRLIDHPIPIPSRKQHLVIACRVASMAEGLEYRNKLKTMDLQRIRENAFT